jgi:hypothetical protein
LLGALLDAVHDAPCVDAHDAVEVRLVDLEKRKRLVEASVVEQDVEQAEAVHDRLDSRLNLAAIPYIDLHADRASRPFAFKVSATAFALSPLRSAMAIAAPSEARRRATPSPMPCAPGGHDNCVLKPGHRVFLSTAIGRIRAKVILRL